MKSLIIHCLLIVSFNGIFFNISSGQTDLPKIIKPAPSTSDLFKFQDYPMDYSTGLPQISIPIYEVNSGSLSVPISISYHASGRKVYDQDGPIALGWSLSAGGSISRVVHGAPDFGAFKFPYPFNLDNITNYNDLAYLQRIMRYQDNNYCGGLFPYYDAEYDVFSYSLPGNSGKFIFKDNNNVKTPVLLPYKPFVITPINPSPGVVSFEITDDRGITYQFGSYENTQIDQYTTTGWMLEKMISADKTDTISFVYTGGTETRRNISQTITYKDNWVNGGGQQYPPDPNPSFAENTSQLTYQVVRLSEIKFNQGKVKFNLVSGTLRFDNIQILNLKNEVIKTIQFNRTSNYYQSEISNQTYKLDSIQFRDRSNTTMEKYAFEYYPVVNSDVNGPINVRYCDWWGYYNNSGQHDMLPLYTVSAIGPQSTMLIGNPNANRQPSLEPLKSAVLKKITYPTGGTSEFTYELNKCKINGGDGSIVNGPGLRVYQINSTDGNGILNTRTFKYGINESDYGFLELLPDISVVKNEFISINWAGGSWNPEVISTGPQYYRQRDFYSSMYEEVSELAERPVLYQEVTEYKGTLSSNTGKTVYSYDYAPWAAAGLFPKKHIYNFNYWNNPALISQVDYKNNQTAYQKVKSTRSLYTSTTTEYIRGLHIQRAYSTPQAGYGLAYPPGSSTQQSVCSEKYGAYEGQSPFVHIPIYSFSDYRVEAGFKNLTQTIDTLFTDAGNIITTANYAYNSKNFVSNTTTTTSKAETLLSETKYPFDYTGNATLTQMAGLNMLNYPVEQINTRNAVPVNAVRTNYLNWGTSPARIYPQTVDAKQGSGLYETRLRYNQYDNLGNVVNVSKENDIPISYIWDYSSTYPIAELRNVSTTEATAYTSFEADGKGNWTFTGLPFTDGSAPMGRKVYNVTTTTPISKSGLNASAYYIVSYWTKNTSAFSITGTQAGYPLNSYTINNWKYFEHKIFGQTSVSISGTGIIDEVRLYPVTAQMTTYTFDPLVGMTNQCDANNRITKYEYDDYNRLILIRDQDKNILKKIGYKYSGQTENNNIYYNDARSGSFTTACAAGYTGSSVSYTVPAGTYSASSLALANQKADADVNTNGQAYANAVGTCTQQSESCSFTVSSGFNIITSSISKTGSTVSFYIVLKSATGSTNWYSLNQVATVSTGCRPSFTRTVYISESGRNWEVIIYSNGGFNIRLLSGTPPSGTAVFGLSGGTYSL